MSKYRIYYQEWFILADQDQDQRVTGEDAVEFFLRSGLPKEQLSKVWVLANNRKSGYLDCDQFCKAMELIGMAQHGMEITGSSYEEQVQKNQFFLAKMEGLEVDEFDDDTAMSSQQFEQGYNKASVKRNQSLQIKQSQNTLKSFRSQSLGPAKSKNVSNIRSLSTNTITDKQLKPVGKSKRVPVQVVTSVVDGLKLIYYQKIRALEETYKFGNFFSPLLMKGDFDAKPSIVLLGQYSTGKTTFIRSLLGRSYPGAHIGPEPTTDRFVSIYSGPEDRRTPGNTLAVQPDQPYQGIQIFGTGFLSRFEGAQCSCKLLDEISIIDTPGVLSGEKQRIERAYNFVEVCRWFIGKADLILLLFDPYKLDISDEFKQVMNVLKGNDDKVRVVLNKADQCDQQQLMRVYGALMWSLGKVFKTPEVVRVYIGSFNADAPIQTDKNPHGKELFEAEQRDLMDDLLSIPKRSCDRRINEFVKRIRAFKIHMLIIGEVRSRVKVFSSQKKLQSIVDNLEEIFLKVQRENHLAPGDFPDVSSYRDILVSFKLKDFPQVDKKTAQVVDDVMTIDIPQLVKRLANPF